MRQTWHVLAPTAAVYARVKCFHCDTQEGVLQVLEAHAGTDTDPTTADILRGAALPFNVTHIKAHDRTPLMMPVGTVVDVVAVSGERDSDSSATGSWRVESVHIKGTPPADSGMGDTSPIDPAVHRRWRERQNRIDRLLSQDTAGSPFPFTTRHGKTAETGFHSGEEQILSWLQEEEEETAAAADGAGVLPFAHITTSDVDDVNAIPIDF